MQSMIIGRCIDMEYLPLPTTEPATDRSRLEAMQRGVGLQLGAQTTHWHSWITHPLTGQEALIVQNEADKEFFTAEELTNLLTQSQAENDDWFLIFEVNDV